MFGWTPGAWKRPWALRASRLKPDVPARLPTAISPCAGHRRVRRTGVFERSRRRSLVNARDARSSAPTRLRGGCSGPRATARRALRAARLPAPGSGSPTAASPSWRWRGERGELRVASRATARGVGVAGRATGGRPGRDHPLRRPGGRRRPAHGGPPRLRVRALGRTRLETAARPSAGEWLGHRPGQVLKYLICERGRSSRSRS